MNRASRYLFFITSRPGVGRVLAGFYEVGWWCGEARGANRDVRLAADRVHFVADAVPVVDLPMPVRMDATRPMRSCRPVDAEETAQLLDVLGTQPDVTPAYLLEIDRLERFNAFRTFSRYPGWGHNEPFSWDLAPAFLTDVVGSPVPGATGVKNQSKSQLWRCPACDAVLKNRSRLRRCPACKEVVTLEIVGNPA